MALPGGRELKVEGIGVLGMRWKQVQDGPCFP